MTGGTASADQLTRYAFLSSPPLPGLGAAVQVRHPETTSPPGLLQVFAWTSSLGAFRVDVIGPGICSSLPMVPLRQGDPNLTSTTGTSFR
ncbi:MAG: hypothetical protein OXL68_05420 [Paracoccaceae bacterium]|nr:hypothetical protein [Paracoccaceae bacterium]